MFKLLDDDNYKVACACLTTTYRYAQVKQIYIAEKF